MKGDNARKETSTPSSRILNRSGDVGGAKASNELGNSPSASGEIRAHDPAPSGAQSSTNPTTSRPALADTAASILRNALTITAFAVDRSERSPQPAHLDRAELLEVDRLMRLALQQIEAPAAATSTKIPLYRPDPVTPPSADLAEQLRQMEKTNAELAGDPLALFEDGGAGSGR